MKYLIIRLQSGLTQGLLGYYYLIKDVDKLIVGDEPLVIRVDPFIDFIWFESPFSNLDVMDFVVRWEGYLRIDEEGYYVFFMECDDGCVLQLDNEEVINGWKEQPPTLYYSKPLFLSRGSYKLKVNYFNVGPFGLVKLGWVTPKGLVATLPSDNLYTRRGEVITIKGLRPDSIVELWNNRLLGRAVADDYGMAFIKMNSERPIDGYFKIMSNGDLEFQSPVVRDIWGGDVFEVKEL